MKLVTVIVAAAITGAVHAKPNRHHHGTVHHRGATVVCNLRGCSDSIVPAGKPGRVVDANGNRVVSRTIRFIPHPSGCPSRSFCACGLAKFWGIWRPALNRVATWAHVFRHVPAPDVGVAAVRRDRHHIIGIIGGAPGRWIVRDYNSGHHRSRVRVVSDFRGYFFVDPREQRADR
jgi:hypothetical protein